MSLPLMLRFSTNVKSSPLKVRWQFRLFPIVLGSAGQLVPIDFERVGVVLFADLRVESGGPLP